MNSHEAIKLYEEMLIRWLKLKKEGRLMRGDEEPDPVAMGVDSWAAGQIKKRLEREVERSA